MVLSLEVADFGQMSPFGNPALDKTSGNPAFDASLNWTDRLGLSTDCQSDDIPFFVQKKDRMNKIALHPPPFV